MTAVLEVAQIVLVLTLVAVWLGAVIRAGRDQRLTHQGRVLAFFLILAVPVAAIVYWATYRSSQGPFLVGTQLVEGDPESDRSEGSKQRL
jgi:membrane protease YdiL (CAAX protease family)